MALYFGAMTPIALAYFLATGAVSYLACLLVLRAMYRRLAQARGAEEEADDSHAMVELTARARNGAGAVV